MKALVYHGPNDVQLDDKRRPNIQIPEDVILSVTQLHYVVLTFIFIMVLYPEWSQDKH